MALDLSTYPPKWHQERITAYQRYERLFLGQHKLVFAVVPQPYQMKRYIVANFAGLISRLSADLLFDEQPDSLATQGDKTGRESLSGISPHSCQPEPFDASQGGLRGRSWCGCARRRFPSTSR